MGWWGRALIVGNDIECVIRVGYLYWGVLEMVVNVYVLGVYESG